MAPSQAGHESPAGVAPLTWNLRRAFSELPPHPCAACLAGQQGRLKEKNKPDPPLCRPSSGAFRALGSAGKAMPQPEAGSALREPALRARNAHLAPALLLILGFFLALCRSFFRRRSFLVVLVFLSSFLWNGFIFILRLFGVVVGCCFTWPPAEKLVPWDCR